MSLLHAPSQPASPSIGRAPRLRQHGPAQWAARLSAVLAWGVAGFVTAYWTVAWMGQGASTALPPQPWAAPEVDSQAVARALGAVPVVSGPVAPQPDASGRYVLLGVVAEGGGIPSARRSHGGVALIATDGQRARPYAVGATVDGRWVVQAVTNRTVVLQPMGAAPAGKQTTPDNAPGTITLVLPKP